MRPKISIKNNQEGLASIVITTVLIIVISIIVIGTLQTVRRNQREALDRQLSSQAFYAAESGVNDAVKALKAGYLGYASSVAGESTDAGTGNKTHCSPDINGGTPPSPLAANTNSNILNGTAVQYTCLLINQKPKNASYTVETDQPTGIDISTGSQITNLILVWNNADVSVPSNQTWDIPSITGYYVSKYPSFPAATDWTQGGNPMIGVLRAAITNLDCSSMPSGHCFRDTNNQGLTLGNPNDMGTPYTRSSLNNNTYTAYFYPRPGNAGGSDVVCGATTLASPDNGKASYIDNRYDKNDQRCQGQIMKAGCGVADPSHGIADTHSCIMNINMTNAHSKHIFLRLNSIYTRSALTVSAWNGATNLPLVNTQAVIDVTGKAQDVLRRIQVRVPIGQGSTNVNPPLYALQVSNGICKELSLGLDYGQNNPAYPECIW